MASTPAPVPAGEPDIQALLDRFEDAWRSSTPPRIEEFLPCGPARPRILQEMIKLDLEYRWRSSERLPQAEPKTTGPRLEAYIARFPELGSADRLPIALIGEEYWVRQRWGDRPRHDEYAARFPRHGSALLQSLQRLDRHLNMEQSAGANGLLEACQPIVSVAAFLDTLRRGPLLGMNSEVVLAEMAGRFTDARALGKEFLQRNLLTPYQVNQMLQGRGYDLLVGPYVLLERLGEGGAGQVFKARHAKMNRVVALKLIRKELLADAEVVGRFYREVQILGHLDHPNIVHAYDAGPAGVSHFLAMEYVEGTDLGKLVKQGGLLPVPQACAYIRQAALGLQHAHERGLAHRDIKPHNLIMSVRDGLIKVADLGLARLPRTMSADVTAALSGVKGTGTLTPENAVMIGTADYLAPEQAMNFHGADIRADIYSLGCTFHYLLTGQPPFPAPTLAEKLLKHQQQKPPPLEQFRTDVPPAVAAVLRRMLTKQPADRYQTPGELADALALVSDPQFAPAARRRGRRLAFVAGAGVLALTVLWLSFFGGKGPVGSSDGKAVKNFIDQFDGSKIPASDQLRQNLDIFLKNYPHLKETLRQELVVCWYRHFGMDRAPQIGELLMLLRSPLDQLESKYVPSELRLANLSKELVAVVKDPEASAPIGMTLSPDGSILALAGKNNTVRLWKLGGPKPELDRNRVLTGYPGPVQLMAFSPDSKKLATGSTDQKVRLWNMPEKKVVEYLPEEGRGVSGLVFAPDGNTVASSSSHIELWDVTKEPTRRYSGQPAEGHNGLCGLVFRDKGMIASSSMNGAALVWDLSKGPPRPLTVLDLNKGTVWSLAFSPDGTRLCICANLGTYIWKVAGKDWGQPFARRGRASSAVFAPDGKTLVTSYSTDAGGDTGRVAVEDPYDAAEDKRWIFPEHVRGLAVAADGRHVAVAGRETVYILRLSELPVRPAKMTSISASQPR
jgi:serine/threonine-protein kinase